MYTYHIYTDGACSGNPGPGGWAAVVLDDANYPFYEITGNEPNTTNNRMELEGLLAALTWCCAKTNQNDIITIYTDSAYIFNCFKDKWYTKWIKNGWVNASKQPVANKDLWVALLKLFNFHTSVEFIKVPGHADNIFNNKCDQMVNDILDFKESLTEK